MSISAAGAAELCAQECATPWLVLLILDHPELDQPLRFTCDGVATVCRGESYAAMPFEITLPDDVEGRAPRAQLRIDNTSLEIIARLRALTTPPSLSIRIVRASEPDVIEREWTGLEWTSSQYHVGAVTGTLCVDDMALEEFPYVTFDGRFKGLWP